MGKSIQAVAAMAAMAVISATHAMEIGPCNDESLEYWLDDAADGYYGTPIVGKVFVLQLYGMGSIGCMFDIFYYEKVSLLDISTSNIDYSELETHLNQFVNLRYLFIQDPVPKLSKLPDLSNLTQLREVYLDFNNFEDFPYAFANSVKDVSLLNNRLQHFPPLLGKEMPQLERLTIELNQMLTVPTEDVDGLTNLTYLFMGWQNQRYEDYIHVFDYGFGSSRGFYTRPKKYKTRPLIIDDGVWAKLPALETVSIQQSGLNDSSLANIGECTKLRQLSVAGNYLTTLPEGIKYNTELQYLHLLHNEFKTIPATLAPLKKITMLDVSMNDGITIPAAIARIPLYYLSMNDCNLDKWPVNLKMEGLIDLGIEQNRIPEITYRIKYVPTLTELTMRNNQVAKISERIGELTEFRTLVLQNNNLTSSSFPSSLGKLTKLELLILDNNTIIDCPEDEIYKLKSLTALYMECRFDFQKLATELPSLTELVAQRSSLKSIEGVSKLKALQSLWVGINNLTTIPDEIGQMTLGALGVHMNQLKTLPESITNITNLKRLRTFGQKDEEFKLPAFILNMNNWKDSSSEIKLTKDESQTSKEVCMELYHYTTKGKCLDVTQYHQFIQDLFTEWNVTKTPSIEEYNYAQLQKWFELRTVPTNEQLANASFPESTFKGIKTAMLSAIDALSTSIRLSPALGVYFLAYLVAAVPFFF